MSSDRLRVRARSTAPRTSFYSLPQELRNKIYEFIFDDEETIEITRPYVRRHNGLDVKFAVRHINMYHLMELDAVAFQNAISRTNVVFGIWSYYLDCFPALARPFVGTKLNENGGLRFWIRRLDVYFHAHHVKSKAFLAVTGILRVFPQLQRLDIKIWIDERLILKGVLGHDLEQVRMWMKHRKGSPLAVYVVCQSQFSCPGVEAIWGQTSLQAFNICDDNPDSQSIADRMRRVYLVERQEHYQRIDLRNLIF